MMSDTFDTYIERTLAREGGYSNNPADAGGETMFGITAVIARANGYAGLMRLMTRNQAKAIYQKHFWQQPFFDQLDLVHPNLAEFALDFGINAGTTWPGLFLQRALNVLNNAETKPTWPYLKPDGQIGAVTRMALAQFLAQRGEDGRKVIVGMVRAMASVRYVEIAEKTPTQETFEYGWQLNRALGVASASA